MKRTVDPENLLLAWKSAPSGVDGACRTRMLARSLAIALAAAALTAGSAAGASGCAAGCVAAPAGSGALFLFSGHGWGHGVGMSQYGAYGYAQHGSTYQQILAHYYPGTALGPAPVSTIRVLLADKRKTVKLS